ncbi:heavy metal translocating P-type ATPase [Geobacter hydrogenophilus]|uniref:P-type Zn(2+) transporter n=1 Tax=Geobacter hydrogenophilus TaxID=40983 RepID=A0A9W6G275_9BACT|nr:heavy metal translocating P-type ATPase [Geobacter hydrogenophilus]MBT0895318.1 heavy metal translocating P-type ATPase [Geobacter hydrogenophilus]GLI39544.1 copper-translocating P-type ATPase [Geobacter hydrogenophilus]
MTPQHATLELNIAGLDCPTCAGHLETVIKEIVGVTKVTMLLVEQMAVILYDPVKTTPAAIREKIEDAGYAVVASDDEEAVIEPASITQQLEPGTSTGRQDMLHIENMDCPTEEALIRNKLKGFSGVTGLEFNLLQRNLIISHSLPSLDPVIDALKSVGMQVGPVEAKDELPEVEKTNWWPLIVSGVAALGAEIIEMLTTGHHWLTLLLVFVAILTGGLETYKKGWIALRNRNLNMNALMSIAVTGAVCIGQWPEAAIVMFLFALAELIEAKSLDRARNAIRGLMAMAPVTATVQLADGSWSEVQAGDVALDSIVRVRPGERIALDGVVTEGNSTVDQSPITGESLPVEKGPGEPVFAGTINQAGSFHFRVTARANDSTLTRIIHAVEAAQGSRAPTQRFVDQFARVYTPIVFAIALLVAVVPPLMLGGGWLDWIYKSLVLLVIACPCALVISTPVTIVSGLAAAARHGILIKGGVYLEEGRKLAWLALDKTGTITHGKPAQTDFEPLNGIDTQEARCLAASLASRSDHPVSHAIAVSAEADGIELQEVSEFSALAGRGVVGRVGERMYFLGNPRLMTENGFNESGLSALIANLERQGKSVVLLANVEKPLAVFGVADTIKESSLDAIAELHRLGVRTMMLSGDNQHTAESIARKVGIDEVRAGLLPEDKQKIIETFQGNGGTIGMVGDGINDAPALARADIGFAMGAAGTDTAIETADVALMDDDLRKVALFVRLSRTTSAILKQNITLALGIKAVFLGLTIFGYGTMWMAVFADMGASLLVVGNGLRLLRK